MDPEQPHKSINKASDSTHYQNSIHPLIIDEFMTPTFQYLTLCDLHSVSLVCKRWDLIAKREKGAFWDWIQLKNYSLTAKKMLELNPYLVNAYDLLDQFYQHQDIFKKGIRSEEELKKYFQLKMNNFFIICDDITSPVNFLKKKAPSFFGTINRYDFTQIWLPLAFLRSCQWLMTPEEIKKIDENILKLASHEDLQLSPNQKECINLLLPADKLHLVFSSFKKVNDICDKKFIYASELCNRNFDMLTTIASSLFYMKNILEERRYYSLIFEKSGLYITDPKTTEDDKKNVKAALQELTFPKMSAYAQAYFEEGKYQKAIEQIQEILEIPGHESLGVTLFACLICSHFALDHHDEIRLLMKNYEKNFDMQEKIEIFIKFLKIAIKTKNMKIKRELYTCFDQWQLPPHLRLLTVGYFIYINQIDSGKTYVLNLMNEVHFDELLGKTIREMSEQLKEIHDPAQIKASGIKPDISPEDLTEFLRWLDVQITDWSTGKLDSLELSKPNTQKQPE